MQHVIIVIHLMLVLSLIGVVLLQRSEGGGLGIGGGGGGGGFMSSRGTTNVLTRTTAILAGLFFVTSLVLSILAGFDRKPTSIIQGGSSAPAVPGAPVPPLAAAMAAACSGNCSKARPPRHRRPFRAAGAAVEVRTEGRAGKPALRRYGGGSIAGGRCFVQEAVENSDASICKNDHFPIYTQAQSGVSLFALVELISGALEVRPHGAVHLHHRRRGLLTG